ncbi:MAG: Holliday junction resolvase RuvX [Gammaproteobacteria bacterium]
MSEAQGPTPPSTLLGFDYGERRIGVAVGQHISATATALEVVTVKDGRPDWDAIARLIGEWQAQTLIVGLPLAMDETEQGISTAARRFAAALQRRFALPVQLHDERLSTRAARERLHERGEDPGRDDSMAAQIILEGWLNEQGS